MSCHEQCEVKVQQITLEDGRQAEKHTSFDVDGNEVVEIFVEEKRPKKLEKRIVRERKTIVSKETHEQVRDGEVTEVKVLSLEPDVPLQVREKIQVVDHARVMDGDYATKQDVTDAVVAAMSAMLEGAGSIQHAPAVSAPAVSAQQAVIKNVEENVKNKNNTVVLAMGVLLLGQMAFLGYMMFFM